ncbi:MAG: transcriptional regulator with GAF, ATPase, and Fis domain [Planctomycetota bacterium]|jgi:transcriptional regulator with GAF, ATPase, and Fis domain
MHLCTRLRELIDEARKEGKFAELSAEWRKQIVLHAKRKSPEKEGEPELPGRFDMIGGSPKMLAVFDLIERVAPTNVPVLILGETGTGKELVARSLHSASLRADGPFQAENCAAVPATLLESELFGHVKGAFTGAIANRSGTFASGDGGTVFLDEIGDMPLDMQSKLLRALQDGEIRPVGSSKVIKVDFRLVAATNKDLAAMCEARTFREDLYYRLNVVSIGLPPLREREGDVRWLLERYLRELRTELGRELSISDDALRALEAWSWPGNVRELQNELQRAAVFADEKIGLAELSPQIAAGA